MQEILKGGALPIDRLIKDRELLDLLITQLLMLMISFCHESDFSLHKYLLILQYQVN